MGPIGEVGSAAEKNSGRRPVNFKLPLLNKLLGMALITVILCSIPSLSGIKTMAKMKKTVETLNSNALPSVVLLGEMESSINLMDRNTVFSVMIGMQQAAGSQGPGQPAPAGEGGQPAAEEKTAGSEDGAPQKATTPQDSKPAIQANAEHIDALVAEYENNYLDAADQEAFLAFKANWVKFRDNVLAITGIRNASGQSSENTGQLYALTLDGISKLRETNSVQAAELVAASADQQETGRSTAIAIMVITVLLGLLGTYLLTRSITKPLSRIVGQVKTVTHGNLQVEPLNVRNRDEVGELASDFNQMCASLRTLMTTVVDNSHLVSSTSEQLTASAEQTSTAAEQIAVRAGELAEGAREQLSRISTTTGTALDVSKRVSGISENFHAVAGLIAETQEKARQGNGVVQSTVNRMKEVQEKVVQSSESANIVGQKTSEIGEITSLIQEIASQTNLLSLNAAIEAARAGEQGRGFAVVAAEVGKLANQSEEATRKISALLADLSSSGVQLTQTMKDSVDSLTSGMVYVEKAGESFSEIVDSVEQVGAEAAKAAEEAKSVNADTLRMVASMEEIARIAERASESTETVAAVVEETMASMQEVSAGSSMLSKMADGLNEAVSIFKV